MTDLSRPLRIHQPRRVEFGLGTAAEVGSWARAEGFARILVLTQNSMAGRVAALELPGAVTVFAGVKPEPDTDNLALALAAARGSQPDLVVGFGGGSVMDLAKLVTVLRGGQVLAEIIGPNRVTARQNALALVPTTAGTGSEAGIRALVTDVTTGMKVAVESPFLLADMVAMDPGLTMTLPPAVTAATGIDAFALMGIDLVARHLPRAVADGSDAEARAGLLLAAYYGGICLGPVNTAAGHALAYPLGTRLKLPHGLANAIIFPHVLAFNGPVVPEKTARIAGLLGLEMGDLLASAHGWCAALGVKMRLSENGATDAQLVSWAAEAHGIRRLMDFNPRDMSVAEVEAI